MKVKTENLKGSLNKMKAISIIIMALLTVSLFSFSLATAQTESGVPSLASTTGANEASLSSTEVAGKSGFSVSDVEKSIEEFETDPYPNVEHILIAINFRGPEVKGYLVERRKAVITQEGEKYFMVDRAYRGALKTIDEGGFRIRADDLSSLTLYSLGTSSQTSNVDESNMAIGKANLDTSERTLTISLKGGETKTYKLTNVERRPVKEIVSGREVSNTATDGAVDTPKPASFWERWFVRSDRTRDSATISAKKVPDSVADSVSDDSIQPRKERFWKRFGDFFRAKNVQK